MSDYHFVRWFPSDYLRDTRRLSTAEHGAYFLLLNEYYLTGEPLPDDDVVLARITLSERSAWCSALRPALSKFFNIGGGVWRHKRCDDEIARAVSTRAARVKGAEQANAQRNAQRALSGTQPEPELESESEQESTHPRARVAIPQADDDDVRDSDDRFALETATMKARQADYTMEEIQIALRDIKAKGKRITNLSGYLMAVCKSNRETIAKGKSNHLPAEGPTSVAEIDDFVAQRKYEKSMREIEEQKRAKADRAPIPAELRGGKW